jgi:hypothetical protein
MFELEQELDIPSRFHNSKQETLEEAAHPTCQK